MVKVWKLYVRMRPLYVCSCIDRDSYCEEVCLKAWERGGCNIMWWSVFIDFECNTEYQVDFVWQTVFISTIERRCYMKGIKANALLQ